MGSKKNEGVTTDLCVGCVDRDVQDGLQHYCKVALTYVYPVVATYPKGEKCRDVLCTHRVQAQRQKALMAALQSGKKISVSS